MSDISLSTGLTSAAGTRRLSRRIGLAIIGLSGYVTQAAHARGIELLTAQGFDVLVGQHYQEPFERFAATGTAALAQLNQAIADPRVEVVMALRGGYGISRLMPLIDFKKMVASGKRFVGYSDFTLFLNGLVNAGGVAFSGPMLSSDFAVDDVSAFTVDGFWDALLSDRLELVIDSTDSADSQGQSGHAAVDVTGTLWGGNLTMLTHLVGTPWLPSIEGGILFVEDVNEQPFRIERALLQLLYSGVLSRQKALLLGDFSQYKLTHYDNGFGLDSVVAYLRSQVSIPVLTGLPVGHIADTLTLPVGAQARLVSDPGRMTLSVQNPLVLTD